MKHITTFLKGETVLCIAGLLAILSCFIVPPGAAYLDYIDFSTLALLFSLMAVVAGLQKMTVFDRIGAALLRRVRTTRSLALVASLLCFFSAMLLTNDVALITFVPLAIYLCRQAGAGDRVIFVVVMQTMAANLGSMLTPVGNPQNLYLYGASGMGLVEFLGVTALPTAVSLAMIVGACMLSPARALEPMAAAEAREALSKPRLFLYAGLFCVCLCTVLKILHWGVSFGIVLVMLLVFDRKVLKKVDYALLATFVCFFIFVGNLGAWPAVSDWIGSIVVGRELEVGILASQVISNVPAALLLSGFTENLRALILGVDLGGLGTLIASLASLISYKLYARSDGACPGRYMAVFTAWNVGFLAILYVLFGMIIA